MSRNSTAAKPPSRHVEDLLEEGPVPSNFQARGSPGLLASPLPPPGNRKGRSCVIQRRQNPGGQVSQGPREDAHDLIPRVVLCQPVLVDDEDGESQDRPLFVSQDVPAQHLEALVAVASHGHAVAPQPDAGHGLWADSKGSGRGCMLLELAGLEVAPVARGLISSTLLVHDREHLTFFALCGRTPRLRTSTVGASGSSCSGRSERLGLVALHPFVARRCAPGLGCCRRQRPPRPWPTRKHQKPRGCCSERGYSPGVAIFPASGSHLALGASPAA